MLELTAIEYDKWQLEHAKKKNHSKITTVIGMGQKLCLHRCVAEEWKLMERLEGIFDISFKFHEATTMTNMSGHYSHYQVQRNAHGAAILVRIHE